MFDIVDIKRKLSEMGGAEFQLLAEEYLLKKTSADNINSFGLYHRANKTTKGNPDAFVHNGELNKYIFMMAGTDDASNIDTKADKDIKKCLDVTKTGIELNSIQAIYFLYTNGRLSPQKSKELYDECKSKDIILKLYGPDTIAHDICDNYKTLAKKYFGLSLGTDQVLDRDEFIRKNDANKYLTSLNTFFSDREEELEKLDSLVNKNDIVCVCGEAGIGKTRFVLEYLDKHKNNKTKILYVKSNGISMINDFDCYLETKKKLFVFFDDVNDFKELDALLGKLLSNTYKKQNIKILMTLKNVYRQTIFPILNKYKNMAFFDLPVLSSHSIYNVISNNFSLSDDTIRFIGKMSNGNVRIAMMIANIYAKDKNVTCKDLNDIYDYYYSNICNMRLDMLENIILLYICVHGKLNIMFDHSYKDVFKEFGINEGDIINGCKKLREKEIISFEDEIIARIPDQSLKNYYGYYLVFNLKMISFAKIMDSMFPKYGIDIITWVNDIISIYGESNIVEDVTVTIKKLFENSDYCYSKELIAFFGTLIPDLALKYYSTHYYEDSVVVEKNGINIEATQSLNPYFNILNIYKNTCYFDESLLLALSMLKKNEKQIPYFLEILKEGYLVINPKEDNDFSKEKEAIDIIFKSSLNDDIKYNIARVLIETAYNYSYFDGLVLKYNDINYNGTVDYILFRSYLWDYIKKFDDIYKIGILIKWYENYEYGKIDHSLINSELRNILDVLKNTNMLLSFASIDTIVNLNNKFSLSLNNSYENNKKYLLYLDLHHLGNDNVDYKYIDLKLKVNKDNFTEILRIINENYSFMSEHIYRNYTTLILMNNDFSYFEKFIEFMNENDACIDTWENQIISYFSKEKNLFNTIKKLKNNSIRDCYMYEYFNSKTNFSLVDLFRINSFFQSRMDKNVIKSRIRSIKPICILYENHKYLAKKLILKVINKRKYNLFIYREYCYDFFEMLEKYQITLKYDVLELVYFSMLEIEPSFDITKKNAKKLLDKNENKFIDAFVDYMVKIETSYNHFDTFSDIIRLLNQKQLVNFLDLYFSKSKSTDIFGTNNPYLIAIRINEKLVVDWFTKKIDIYNLCVDMLIKVFSVVRNLDYDFRVKFLCHFLVVNNNINTFKQIPILINYNDFEKSCKQNLDCLNELISFSRTVSLVEHIIYMRELIKDIEKRIEYNKCVEKYYLD